MLSTHRTEAKSSNGGSVPQRQRGRPAPQEEMVNDYEPAQARGGLGTKHWRRLQPGRDNPREVAAARLRLAEEIMGEDATRKLKVRGLVFPRWRAARHPAAPMLKEYATRGCPVQTG